MARDNAADDDRGGRTTRGVGDRRHIRHHSHRHHHQHRPSSVDSAYTASSSSITSSSSPSTTARSSRRKTRTTAVVVRGPDSDHPYALQPLPRRGHPPSAYDDDIDEYTVDWDGNHDQREWERQQQRQEYKRRRRHDKEGLSGLLIALGIMFAALMCFD
ncbi:hypothetical protein B0H63DRAFT_126520 [Podospora didyma]|uniref:Uncharacterized protein n=1 Tax=Podospora didyma TaxID=330526 RepID=A0AAE0P0R3_9PEZI|nr:hypothetical protein B0H63DRAFT_126520 [Podospora didyma]